MSPETVERAGPNQRASLNPTGHRNTGRQGPGRLSHGGKLGAREDKGLPHTAHATGLKLADPLSADAELHTQVLQRGGTVAEVALLDDVALSIRERSQGLGEFFLAEPLFVARYHLSLIHI